VTAGNADTAQRATHTMKSLAAQLGGIALAQQMRTSNEQLKAGQMISSTVVADLRAAYTDLEAALRRWME
jgi:hypothetical protein